MKTHKYAILAGLLAGLIAVASPSARATIITWGSAQNWNGVDTQVLNNGTAVAAVTTWTTDLTLNSVTFTHETAYSTANGSITFGGSTISLKWDVNAFPNFSGAPNQNYTGGSPGTDYRRLVWLSGYGHGATGNNAVEGPGTGAITLTGLTAGHDYQVQVWAPVWSNSSDAYLIDGVQVNNSTPQFIVGTFTAVGTSQAIPWSFLASGSTYAYAPAAVSLRDIPIVVPEPTTALLLALGGFVIVGYARRRQRRC